MIHTTLRFFWAVVFFLPSLLGQADQPLTNSQLAEATQADAYFVSNNIVAALPLYERLAKELPDRPVYHVRLAFCLMSEADNLAAGPEKLKIWTRFKAEASQAKAQGDTSNLLQVMLDRIKRGEGPAVIAPGRMQEAEAAFSKGQLDAALEIYKQIASEDPTDYDARLFAGDIYFRRHDVRQAGEWFQKAIVVDPNRETAYRYWGDALFRDGEKDEAEKKFIDAIIAEPYNRRSWTGLTQWA